MPPAEIHCFQPHSTSDDICVVHSATRRVVVKEREFRKCAREAYVHRVAFALGVGELVPATECFNRTLISNDGNQTVGEIFDANIYTSYRGTLPFGSKWQGSSSTLVEVMGADFDETSGQCHKLATQLRKDSPMAVVDLAQLYMRSALAKLIDGQIDEVWEYTTTISNQELLQVWRSIDSGSLERLILFLILVDHCDASSENHALRVNANGRFDLVVIDNTCTLLEEEDADSLVCSSSPGCDWSGEQECGGKKQYWYPEVLAMPQVRHHSLSAQSRELVMRWTVQRVSQVMQRENEYGTVTTASIDRALKRLKQLHSVLENYPDGTLQQVAFEVMPHWRRDWAHAVRDSQLLAPVLATLGKHEGTDEDWVRRVESCSQKQASLNEEGEARSALACFLPT